MFEHPVQIIVLVFRDLFPKSPLLKNKIPVIYLTVQLILMFSVQILSENNCISALQNSYTDLLAHLTSLQRLRKPCKRFHHKVFLKIQIPKKSHGSYFYCFIAVPFSMFGQQRLLFASSKKKLHFNPIDPSSKPSGKCKTSSCSVSVRKNICETIFFVCINNSVFLDHFTCFKTGK